MAKRHWKTYNSPLTSFLLKLFSRVRCFFYFFFFSFFLLPPLSSPRSTEERLSEKKNRIYKLYRGFVRKTFPHLPWLHTIDTKEERSREREREIISRVKIERGVNLWGFALLQEILIGNWNFNIDYDDNLKFVKSSVSQDMVVKSMLNFTLEWNSNNIYR